MLLVSRPKRIKVVFIGVIFLLFYLGFAVWMNWSLRQTVKLAFQDLAHAPHLTAQAREQFDMSVLYSYYESETVEHKLRLSPGIVLHSFFQGYAWFTYDHSVIDRTSKQELSGAGDVPIRLHFKLQGGHWVIDAKKERP